MKQRCSGSRSRSRTVRPTARRSRRTAGPYLLLITLEATEAVATLARLPPAMQERLDALSPVQYLAAIRAPLLIILHDRGDTVIPVTKSRHLRAALAGRPGVRYAELGFEHLNPARVSPRRLVRDLARFSPTVYPVFRQAVRW
jgi:hypothetical protein